MRYFYVFIFLVGFSVGQANNPTLDDPYRITTQLKHAKNDVEKAGLLLDLADIRLHEDAIRSLGKTKLALVLGKNNKDSHIQFRALCLLINIYTAHLPDPFLAGNYLKQLKEIPFNLLSEDEKGKSYYVEGQVFMSLFDYPKAQKAFFIAREFYEKSGAKSAMPKINFNLGQLNYNRDDYISALVYFNQAHLGFKEIDDQNGEIEALKMLGLSNLNLGHTDDGLQYLEEGLQLSQNIDNIRLQSAINLVFAHFYYEKGDYLRLKQYLDNAIDINEVASIPEVNADIEKYLGLLALDNCDEIEATLHLNNALAFIEKSNENKKARDIYKRMYTFYSDNGHDSLAFSTLKLLMKRNETVYNDQKSIQLITNRVRYESEKIEEENEKLKAQGLEISIAYQQQRFQNYALILLFVVILSVLGFLYYSYRQKKNYNTKLEKLVIERTEQLNQSNLKLSHINEKLGDSNTELERFAYIASHDLKSPLRNIISFVGLISRKLKGVEDEEILEYLQYVKTNAEQMNDLIRDILEFSKVETMGVEKVEVDANLSLCNALQNMTTLIDAKHAKISSDALPCFYGQNSQIIQLFQNLISNGIKYNQNSPPFINIKHKIIDNFHQISISDNGIGISDEYKEKVFEMFSRLHTKEEYNGTGIGLAVCKKIVKKLGGEIWLNSEKGKGTTFSFSVPVSYTQ